uniref:PROP1-like PPR domain-containing protein n=1 Tax=Leersia perrieri TaxID=77586 RepID=A0A0D9XI89_9ORYZ
MDASSSAATPHAALTLLTSSPRFLHLPLCSPARRHVAGGGGGVALLLRPPPTRRKGERGGQARRAPSCFLGGGSAEAAAAGVLGVSVVAAAAALLAAALQLVWLRLSGGDSPEEEVLYEHGKSIVNKAFGTPTDLVDDSNYSSRRTHENVFSEQSISGRMIVDRMDCQTGIFSGVDTVNNTTQVGSVISTYRSLDTFEGVPANKSSIETVQHILPNSRSVSEGQLQSRHFANRGGLPHQFLSLSKRKEQVQNGQGPSDNKTDSDDANSLGCHQSDQGEYVDLTSLSSFKEHHLNFMPEAHASNLFQPSKALEFTNSYAGGSYLTAGRLAPVACLRDGPVSKRKKAVHDHDDAKLIGWSISNLLEKENPENSTSGNRVGLKGTKDMSDYLRRYNSLLVDGRLKDSVDLLESMEQKELLDMNKIHHASFLNACKKQRAVMEAVRFCRLIDNPKMSTFNMLLSVCANSQDFDGALQVMVLLKEAGLKPDCKLYTTLISTCAKCGKVDAMFEVFHEMVSAGIEPNVNTYSALIDGCAKAGQVAKAFGAYGIMSSKKVKPDRVVFNALISACGESGAVARAFDVLSEMTAEASESKGTKPILPDHVTVGALMKTCIQAGQADRAREVYKMLQEYNIKGTPEVYTIALRSCSLTGDLGFALKIYEDMSKIGVQPDEMFLSALVDVAGHAKRADAAFEIMKDARAKGYQVGTIAYSSLMGACCNAKDWKKALQLFEEIKSIKLMPTVSMMNALITSLCEGDQVLKSIQVLNEMTKLGVSPNQITYSVLFVACERNAEAQVGLDLFEQLKIDGINLNPTIVGCLTGLCLQMFDNDLSLGNIVVTFNLGKPQIENKWTSSAIKVYREAISAGLLPSSDEAASLGAVESISMKDTRIFIDARKSKIYTAEVSLLTTLRSLKHRLAAGARLPNVTILLPTEKKQVELDEKEKTLKLAGRVGQAVGALLRRLGIKYHGEESHGKMRINGLTLRRWFNPKFTSTSSTGTPADLLPLPSRLAKGIADQQRNIRNLSLE